MMTTSVVWPILERCFSLKVFNLVTGPANIWPLERVEESGVRLASPNDIPLLETANCTSMICRRWFRRGARAWIKERDGKLVACFWLHQTKRYHLYDWLIIKSAPQDVWVVWWWVDRQNRGEKWAYRIRVPGVMEAAHAGCTRMLGMVDAWDRSAAGATRKINWQILGRLYVTQIFGVTGVYAPGLFRVGQWSLGAPLEISLDLLMNERQSTQALTSV
jgi:hypothetical protein